MTQPSPLGEIRVCLFDAYGTLFNIGAMADPIRARLGDRADELIALWRRKQLDYTWLRTLIGHYSDFWHVTGQALDYALARLEIDDPALRAQMMQAWLTPPVFPDARPALERLSRSGCRLGVLSNGSAMMLTSAINAAGLTRCFDMVLSVDPLGLFKPHPSVYRLGAERFGVEPKAVGFVSSNGWDIAGAASFGFQTVWANRDAAPPEGLPAGPRVTIAALSELPAQLGA